MKTVVISFIVIMSLIVSAYGQGIDSLKLVLQKDIPILEKRRYFLNLMQAHTAKDDSATLVDFINKAVPEVIRYNEKEFEPMAYYLQGLAFYTAKDHQNAISSYEKALASAKTFKESRIIINSCTALRYYSNQNGEKRKSLEYSLTSLEESEKINETRGLAVGAMNVGHSYKELGRPIEARQYYRKSYVYAVKDKNPTMIPKALISLGNVSYDLKLIDSALNYFFVAIKYCDSAREYPTLLNAYASVGRHYAFLKSYDSALYYFDKAKDIAKMMKDYPGEVNSLGESAKIYSLRGDYKRSNDSLVRALNIAGKLEIPAIRIEIYKTLVENYTRLGDSINAFRYLQLLKDHMSESQSQEFEAFNLLIDNIKKTNLAEQLMLSNDLQRANYEKKISNIAKSQSDSNARYQTELKDSAVAGRTREQILKDTAIERQKREEKAKRLAVDEAERANKAEDNAKDDRDIAVIASILLALSLIYSIYLQIKNKKISRDIIEANASELKLASAIKNHNLGDHYDPIREAIAKGRFVELDHYLDESANYFELFYKSLVKDKISLQEEIDILKKFALTEQILSKKNITRTITYNGLDPAKTLFLSDTLVSTYQNALSKAFEKDDLPYHFDVNITRQDSLLICLIRDDGKGNDHIYEMIREKSYLDMLRKRALNAFKRKRIKMTQEDVFQITSSVEGGTTIKLTLPYEVI